MDEMQSPPTGTVSFVTYDHEAALAPLGALARRHLPAPVTEGATRAAHLRFLGAQRVKRAPGRVWWVAAGAGAVAALLVTIHLATPGPLGVTVTGGAIEEGGFIRVPADGESSLHFSDGTSVELARASRMRIAATNDKGSRLLLEEGRAHATIVPKRGARWLFDAGPCRVRVTGTEFDMRWSARDQILEVWLARGSVVVQGPPAPDGVVMRAGQHLAMDVRRGTVRFGTAAQAPEPTPPPSESPEAPRVSNDGAAPQVVPLATRNPGAKRAGDWAARVAGGDFAGVVAEAEQRGIGAVLKHDSAANVMALADAARYANRLTLARRSLVEVRARFPRSTSAHRAAFLLGRISEDNDGDVRLALGWYTSYLSDQSDDVYRAEALGRQMTATLRVQGVGRARPLAATYLQRYPHGAYADAARAILPP